MNALRTLIFRIVFYTVSVPIVLATPITALFGRRALIANTNFWTRVHLVLTRALLGIHPRFEGRQVLLGPVIYAAKHQAMYETLELQHRLGAPAIVMKQELGRIPVWGWASRVYGCILVDRDASAGALRRMLKEAKAALAEGRSILIFPEGTRVAPGEQPPLQAGFAGLYQMLKIPVVPIAIDSGRLSPKHGAKRPGIITFRFGDPILPGLPRDEIEARVHAAINVLDVPEA